MTFDTFGHARVHETQGTCAYKGSGGRARSLCADRAEALSTLRQSGNPCRIGMAQSKVEQTTRALESALLPLPAVGRFTRYVRTGGYMMFALWQSGK